MLTVQRIGGKTFIILLQGIYNNFDSQLFFSQLIIFYKIWMLFIFFIKEIVFLS